MVLTADQTQLLVWLLERTFARHPEGTVPAAIRQLATQAATDIDGAAVAVRLPALLRAIGPEAAARVRAQAAALAGSAQDEGQPPLSASEAARLAGVTSRAIRSACANSSLTGARDKISGEWRIAPSRAAYWRQQAREGVDLGVLETIAPVTIGLGVAAGRAAGGAPEGDGDANYDSLYPTVEASRRAADMHLRAVEAGIDARVRQSWMGHSTLQLTERTYNHVRPAAHEAAAKLAAA